MKNRNPPQPAAQPRTWLITALLAAAAVGYVVLVFRPAQYRIHGLRAEVQERRQQILQGTSRQAVHPVVLLRNSILTT